MKKRRKNKHSIGKFILFIFSIGLITSGMIALWVSTLKVPDFNGFDERKVAQSTKIYDRTGEILLYDIHEDIKRTVVPYGEISHHIKNATVAIEDAEFYKHIGIRPLAILRAVFIQPLRGKGIQGGSTITQQVVKNTLLTSERTISRKLKEWSLAMKIEQVMSKEEILTLYLNEAPYGGNIYGIREASKAFFGKEPLDVTIAEAAYLAALPQAPTFYSPYGNNKDMLDERKNVVLSQMYNLGFITEQEYTNAKNESVLFLPQEEHGIHAPHFVLFIRSYLEEKYGKDVVEQGGLRVTTTLDYDLQSKAEEILKRNALENEDKFNAENAGLIAIDPKTGQILSMVGSRDYFDEEIDGNFNITLAHRQPGSSFKPFVYATAFKKGYTPETTVFDLQTQFQTTCDPEGNPLASEVDPSVCYMPVNYDGIYHGPMTLRNALAQSVNIPAIKTLYLAGLSDSLKTARDFGITSLADINQYGLTLVLGGGEVSLLEMTNAYGVFANTGVRNPYTGILSVEDINGVTLEEFSPHPTRVLDKNIAEQISDVLSDNIARTPAFGARSYLYFENKDVAVKTGTTNDYRDAWIIGYTPTIAVGTWAGNNDNSPMEKKVAGFIVAPMWNEFMQEALLKYPDEKFTKPQKTSSDIKPVLRGIWKGGETYTIDSISGKLATEFTPYETREDRIITNVHTILYWVDKKDPKGPVPEKPESDPQFNLWEVPVQKWLVKNGIVNQSIDDIPKEYDTIHTPELSPHITIINPVSESIYEKNQNITVYITGVGVYPIEKVDYFVNGIFMGTVNTHPFTFTFSLSDIQNIQNRNEIKVVGYDSVFNKGESSVYFTIKQ